MEWHDEGLEEGEECLKFWGGTLAPERPATAAAHERELRLGAFPALFKGEPEEQQLARADAAETCWGALSANIQATLEGTDAGVFQALLSFARQSHRPPGSIACPELAVGCQRIPTGLVLAGGVNSADHGRTFPSLADFLRQQGCYVALLKPEHFTRGPGETSGEVLRQFSGLADSRAEHFAALKAWYEDEAGSVEELAQQAQQAQQADQQEQQAEAGGGGKGDGRALRQRPAPAEQAAEAALAAEQAANRQRPLVVIVEGTEGVDVQCLRDFILVASESHAEVPLTLALGLTTTASALLDLLPSEVVDRCMALRHFRLATGIARLDSLLQSVLLGGSGRWPGLLFSPGIIGRLIDSFLNHYYSTGVITQGLRVAALEHFRSTPASFLAAAALEGQDAVKAALEDLDSATLAEVKRALGGRSVAQLAHAVRDAQAAWSRWAVGLQWLVLAGEALGLQSIDFRPWKLLEEALRPSFAAGPLEQLLAQVDKELRRDGKLSAEAVGQLAAALRQRAACVWGGTEAAAEQLAGLAAVEAGQEEAAEEQDAEGSGQQQQAQQEQAEEQQSAEEQAAEAPAAKKQKRDVFHSKHSRKQALLSKAAEKSSKKCSSAAAAAAAKGKQAAAPGARLAAWLSPAVRALLAEPPTKLPGAVVFTCKDTASLDCLTAEPRAALHLALTEPHHFLRELPEGLGVAPGQEDASLAYCLFDQDPACANLADWYEAYAAVYAPGPGPASAGKKRKAAVKGGKGKGKRKADAEAEGEEEGGGAAGAPKDEAAALQRELAARFSQATADLQYVGLIKPAKRRRGDYVQRVVHMPASGL